MKSEPINYINNQGLSANLSDPFTTLSNIYAEIKSAESSLSRVYILFREENIWPDECDNAIELIDALSKPVQDFYSLLDKSKLTQLPEIVVPLRYSLIMLLHRVDDLVRELMLLITSFRAGCQTSSRNMLSQQQEIFRKLEQLRQVLDSINSSIDSSGMLAIKSQDDSKITIDETSEIEVGNQQSANIEDPPIQLVPLDLLAATNRSIDKSKNRYYLVKDNETSAHTDSRSLESPLASVELQSMSHLDLANIDSVKLRNAMSSAYDKPSLVVLCADLGTTYDNLQDGPLVNKILYLIQHAQHHNIYSKLVTEVLKNYPHLENKLLE